MKKTMLLSLFTCSFLYSSDMPNITNTNITIINEDKIAQSNTGDVKDVLNTESNVNTDGSSLNIRGVGDNGRGIAVIDDGNSQTDVSGNFSFDVDTDELEKLVVYKGPGSIYSVNGTGGVVQTKTKSVFKKSNNIKVGIGSYGYETIKTNIHKYINLDNVINFTYTKKDTDNDYKEHSKSLKDRYELRYGNFIDDTSSIEVGYSYDDSDQDKIQTIDENDFQDFKDGNTVKNDGIWKFNNDDRQIQTTNLKYKKYFGEDLLKINSFYKSTDKTQIQNGKIKILGDSYNFGLDLEYKLKRASHSVVSGISYKRDKTTDNNQYMYVNTDGTETTKTKNGVTTTKIDFTTIYNNTQGDILSKGNNDNNLLGVYIKDNYQINNKFKLETSLRVDKVEFNVDSTSYWNYKDNGDGTYTYTKLTPELQAITKSTTLYTPRASLTYALSKYTNIFATIAHGEQSATDTQLLANLRNDISTDLNPEKATNYEIGLKHATDKVMLKATIYDTITTDEIVEYKDPINNIKYYENAGETEKRGIELGGKYNINKITYIGANYSYNDYQYNSYVGYDSASGSNIDYSGNAIEGTPDYTYALYAGFKNPKKKLRGKIESVTSGAYYTDKSNTIKYDGYNLVTNISMGWEPKRNHTIMFNANNIFDNRYASKVTTTSDTTYTLASPQTFIISYKYNF